MGVTKAQFLVSAANQSQWPDSNRAEILLCGRSNVGKSSFINALCNRKSLAYTSSTPGMTRLLNFYEINDSWMFVDAPGYGFQQKKRENYEAFDALMSDYFSRRKQLCLCLLLLDSRREPNQDDLDMLRYIQANHHACIAVLTKCDKLSNNELAKQKRIIAQKLDLPLSELYATSALKKSGFEEVYARMEKEIDKKAARLV